MTAGNAAAHHHGRSDPAKLPVGMDILDRPFSEPVLLKIAGAYEHATHQRTPPPEFGQVAAP